MLVYVASYMSHRAFLQCSLDALYRGATEDLCSVFRYSWEGFETNRGLRGCFLLPGGGKGVSLKVLFCSWRFFCSFFGWPVQEHLCILQGSFDIPRSDSGKIVVCAGVFLQCSLDALYRLATRHFCAGAWKNRGMCPCFFCWLLVKKLISQKTFLGVVICAN